MKLLKAWLPVLLWTAVIVGLSNDQLSSEQTAGVLHGFLSRFFSPEVLYFLNIFVRKAGHVSEYGILALLAWRAAAAGYGKPLFVAPSVALVVASVDEYRQSFTTYRTGTPWDVVIDTCAATVVALLLYRGAKRRQSAALHSVVTAKSDPIG